MLNGCVFLMQEKYDGAETFFEAATCVDEKSILAWTVLGTYVPEYFILVDFDNKIGAIYLARE